MGIFDKFTAVGNTDKSPIDVLLDLLQKENIELKTDLNITQIRILWQMKFYTDLKRFPKDDPYKLLWNSLEYFMLLMTSLKRERVREIIKGLTDMRESMAEYMSLASNLQGGKK